MSHDGLAQFLCGPGAESRHSRDLCRGVSRRGASASGGPRRASRCIGAGPRTRRRRSPDEDGQARCSGAERSVHTCRFGRRAHSVVAVARAQVDLRRASGARARANQVDQFDAWLDARLGHSHSLWGIGDISFASSRSVGPGSGLHRGAARCDRNAHAAHPGDRSHNRRARQERRCLPPIDDGAWVGAITSLLFVATLDDVTLFPSAAKVEAYLGLTPGENSSSERVVRTGITKAGSGALRRVLVQAALSIRRFRRDHPLVLWAAKIQERRGRHIATVALARKLAGILFAIWRDGTIYVSARTATAPMMSA